MNLTIRPVRVEDAPFIHEIRIMDGVRENMTSTISERADKIETQIKELGINDHSLVAEVEENGKARVVATAGLSINGSVRFRHSAGLGMAVHPDYQGKGIGRKLMDTMIELADDWLMMARLELDVIADNDRAVKLYKSLGFEIEGTKKYACIKNGKYEDVFIMARYNKNMIKC